MGGVINVISRAAGPADVRVPDAGGNHNTPKADFFASDVWGKVGVAVEGGAFDTDGFPSVIANERGLGRQPRPRSTTRTSASSRLPRQRPRERVRPGRLLQARTATTRKPSAEINDTDWTTVSGGVRAALPDRAICRRRSSSTTTVPQHVPRRDRRRARPVPPRSIVRLTTDQTFRPTRWRRWCSGRRRSGGATSSAPARLAACGRRQPRGPLCAATGPVGPHAARCSIVRTRLGRHAAQQRPVPAGRNHHEHAGGHAERPRGPLEQLQRSHLRDHGRHRPADGRQPRRAPRQRRHRRSARAAPSLYHVSDKVSVWGDIGWGFRAPTLNELYRQFSVGVLHAGQRERSVRSGCSAARRVCVSKRRATFRSARRGTTTGSRTRCPTSRSPPISQQRQNLGRTRIHGWQNDIEARLSPSRASPAATCSTSPRSPRTTPIPAPRGSHICHRCPKHRGSSASVPT